VEPTETEPVEELDRFVEAVKAVVKEAAEDPETVKTAPHNTYRRRMDEVTAARSPVLTYEG